MEETFMDIKGFEGLYIIGNKGTVVGLQKTTYMKVNNCQRTYKKRNIKPIVNGGYKKLTLYKNKIPKIIYIHRLVAEHFIPNPENKPQVNHIDENKLNNICNNLEWVTPRENLIHGTGIKRRSESKKIKIKSIDENDKEVKTYNCVEDAKIDGFERTGIYRAMKFNRKYKNLIWKRV